MKQIIHKLLVSFTAYFTPPNITLIKKTESSFLFQFQPPDIHGAHIGYLVWFNGSSNSSSGGMPHSENFTLRDGLVFNISALLPYYAYRIKITPLELQNIQSTAVLDESTLESGKQHTRFFIRNHFISNQALDSLKFKKLL